MKGEIRMKKIILFSLTSLLAAGISVAGLASQNATPVSAEEATPTSIAEYIPMTAENLSGSRDDDFRDINVNDYIRPANPSYWDPGRSYGTPYPTLDTFTDEGRIGAFRTRDLNLKAGTYISFLIGGNPHLNGEGYAASFINIWKNPQGDQGGRDVYTNIHNHAFLDPECALNMTFKYFQIPEDGSYLLYIRDGANGGFGGVTFGELRINQTFDEVCKSFSAHKAYYRSAYKGDPAERNSDAAAYNYMVGDVYQREDYRALNERIATFTSGNEAFDVNNGMLGWTVDRYKVLVDGSNAVIGFTNANGLISTADTKWDGNEGWFNIPVPFNKTGAGFFNGEPGHTGLGEAESYRFISHEFKLSSDLISAKLGGGTAVLDVVDAQTHEILATTNNGTYHPNPTFNKGTAGEEAEHARNISKTNTRLNTLTRVYLDVGAHKNKQVRLAISDARTGGDWGLAYFDDIITDYTTAPSYTLETFTQVDGDNTYHGVVIPKYVGGTTSAYGQAYTFLANYYAKMRTEVGSSWCSLLTSQTLTDITTAYNALSAEARAIVDASEDYHHANSETVGGSDNYWLLPVVKGTVGATMAYAMAYPTPSNFTSLLNGGLFATKEGNNIGIMLIALCVSLALVAFIVIKRRKHN